MKETWKKKTKKVNKYDNPYLKKSTNCEVKNKTIKDKAKEITKNIRLDIIKQMQFGIGLEKILNTMKIIIILHLKH